MPQTLQLILATLELEDSQPRITVLPITSQLSCAPCTDLITNTPLYSSTLPDDSSMASIHTRYTGDAIFSPRMVGFLAAISSTYNHHSQGLTKYGQIILSRCGFATQISLVCKHAASEKWMQTMTFVQ